MRPIPAGHGIGKIDIPRGRSPLVILPNIRHGIISTLILTFVLSWEEIAVILFVTSVEVITLPRRIWGGLRDALDPTIAAISAVLILATVMLLLVRTLWPYLRRGSTGES